MTVDVRGHREPAQVVKLPFYKRAARNFPHRLRIADESVLSIRFNQNRKIRRGPSLMDLKTLQFAPTHEWVLLEGNIATVGISKFAVDQLTDLIMIELPAVGNSRRRPARASAKSRASRR